MRILFIVPYPQGRVASQRFRFEQYFDALVKEGYSYQVASFWDNRAWKILYMRRKWFSKFIGFIRGCFNRFKLLFSLSKVDIIFLHREAFPFGPPVFEWILHKVLKKKIIYDFDDAIWLANASDENKVIAQLKWHSKIRSICIIADKISCGNEFLVDFAAKFNDHVVYNPTTIDTDKLHNRIKESGDGIPVIGWTGTHSTLPFLESLMPALQELEKTVSFQFHVISDKLPDLQLINYKTIPWKFESEIEDLLKFDIGVMPMVESEWTEGKCGFKILQYMALGFPALASPTRANIRIIDDGVNGFICRTNEEWIDNIKRLLLDKDLRIKMGKAAREKIIANYSVASNLANLLSLFK